MKRPEVLIFAVILFFPLSPQCQSRGVNGGIPCAGCTVSVGLLMQISQVRNYSIRVTMEKVCSMMPTRSFTLFCKSLVQLYGEIIAQRVTKGQTADMICHGIGICRVDTGEQYCHLFPSPSEGMQFSVEKSSSLFREIPYHPRVGKILSPSSPLFPVVDRNLKFQKRMKELLPFCSIPGLSHVCSMIAKRLNSVNPSVDFDGDKFSVVKSLRGSSWRGKDCNDLNHKVHPGRIPLSGDRRTDSNCNGIKGLNRETGKTYENELCGGTKEFGIIFIGDSISAHFHVPPEWLTAQKINKDVFNQLIFILGNGFASPHSSFATGYMNTDSIYLRLRDHNRCNHRDYQNLAVSGSTSADLNYLTGIARNKNTDKPAIVFYAMMGNDVCRSYMSSPDDLTTPQEFKTNVLKALEVLNDTLPINSHVILMGLADGKFIYPTMKDRYHPLGQLNHDVTYDDVFSWVNCMKIGPCYGWLNKNKTYRMATSKRASQLTKVLSLIAKKRRYKSFKLHFIKNPIEEVLKLWTVDHELWEFLEPVDSLHPTQAAQPYMANVLWNKLVKLRILGKPNPSNERIKKMFGDQGGH